MTQTVPSSRPTFDDRDFPGALFIPKTDPPSQLKLAEGGGTKYEVTFHDKPVKLPIRNSAALTVFTDPLFPESATVERRVAADSLRSHAQLHHKGWMDFVRRYEGFEGTKSIFLVTGYTKTRSWAAALMCRETGKVNPWSVTFKQPDDQSEPISVSPGAKTSRDSKCRGTTGASTAQQPKRDQTPFIHGLLITRRFTRTRILDTTNDREKLKFSLKNSFNSAFLSGKLRSGRIQSSGGEGHGTGRVQSGEGSQESG
ncbi:hypothetical protein V5O48_007204 [Marasmius crinis-equi]|uniref:Uncharacterized protein n=1 Tax=Marasmius crinis-equi TaxID=585013 RepID=A0ABR3FHF0_9AGAR